MTDKAKVTKYTLLPQISRKDPLNELEIIKTIGSGTYGEVFQAKIKETDELAALKSIKIEAGDDFNIVQQEIAILAECKHENIVGYYGSYFKSGKLWIAMEYCGGGSLQDIYQKHGPLPEDAIAFVSRETLKGLEYLHRANMMHRDIKGANLLLTLDGDVKLADFGISATLTFTMKRKSFIGTPYWMAPEVAAVEKKGGYNSQCDIWAVGITAIELAETQPPLFDLHPMTALYMMTKKSFKPENLKDKKKWNKEFHDFIKHLLVKDPMKRPTATQALCHTFVYRTIVRREAIKPLLKYATLPKAKYQITQIIDGSDEDEEEVKTSNPVEGDGEQGKVKEPALRRIQSRHGQVLNRIESNDDSLLGKIAMPGDVPQKPQIHRLQSTQAEDDFDSQTQSPYIDGDKFSRPVPNPNLGQAVSAPATPPQSYNGQVPIYGPVGKGDMDDFSSVYQDPVSVPPRPPKNISLREVPPPRSKVDPPSIVSRPLPSVPKESPRLPPAVPSHSHGVPNEYSYVDPDSINIMHSKFENLIAGPTSLPASIPRTASQNNSAAPPLPPPKRDGRSVSTTSAPSVPSSFEPPPLPPKAPSLRTPNPAKQPPRLGGKDSQACFSKIFHGCPLHVKSATSWVHPDSKDKYVLIGSTEGLYSLLLTNRLDAEMEQMYPKKIWWLSIFQNVMLSITSSHRYMCMTLLLNMYDRSLKDTQQYQHTTKVKGSKGTLRCAVIHNPYNREYYYCGITATSVIILQWFEPREIFMLNVLIDFSFPYEVNLCEGFVYSTVEKMPLPVLITGVRDSGNSNVTFDVFDPNASENYFSCIEEYPIMKMTGISQLEPDTVIAVHDNVVKFVNLQGKVKPNFAGKYKNKIHFDFKLEGYVRLRECILIFHRHGMQAKSLVDEEITAEVFEESKVFNLLGSDRNIIIESRQESDMDGPANLYILASK